MVIEDKYPETGLSDEYDGLTGEKGLFSMSVEDKRAGGLIGRYFGFVGEYPEGKHCGTIGEYLVLGVCTKT